MWCSKLPDETPLSKLSIPGTHDSAAHCAKWYAHIFPCLWKTQSMSLMEQLESGIRYFDIRIKFIEDKPMLLVHGLVELGHFERAGNDFTNFLINNPQQFIIMQVQSHDSSEPEETCTQRLLKYFQSAKMPVYLNREIPRVADIRGKIWVIQTNFKLGTLKLCTWIDKMVVKRDNYILQNLWNGPQATKIVAAKQLFMDQKYQFLRINFMNESSASRGRTSNFYNSLVQKWLEQTKTATGILVMDFPPIELIQQIISHNFSRAN